MPGLAEKLHEGVRSVRGDGSGPVSPDCGGESPVNKGGHIWAHVRRIRAVLEDLENRGSLCRLVWRGIDLGTWQDARAGWQACGNRIRLRLRAGGAAGVYTVSAVRIEAWGVRVSLISGRRGAPEEIHVRWERTSEAGALPGGHLLGSLRRWASGCFPGGRVIRVENRSNPARSLSGSFPRLLLRQDGQDIILLAAPENLPSGRSTSILTQAILWRAHLASLDLLEGTPKIGLLVPAAVSGILGHRARMLGVGEVSVGVYSVGSDGGWSVNGPGPLEEPVEDRDYSWPLPEGGPVHALMGRILALAPGSIQCYPRLREHDSLRILGLEFARAGGPERTKIRFGVGAVGTELTAANFPELEALVYEIRRYRCAASPSKWHPLYRAQSERWLECLILEGVGRLFPELLPGFAYPQIPVCLGELQGRVDILSADREGRLVVMELKTAPDPDLPMQALDYWGRVVAHCRNGDFDRRGYFAGMHIMPRRPRIYLVAPVFSFHDTTETVLAALDRDIEVWKIGINEDWRAGVRVLRRARVR